MTIVRSLKAALAASVCLLPLQVLAQSTGGSVLGGTADAMSQPGQPTNWVTIGGQYASSGSYYLNRFTGNEAPGFYGIGDFHFGWRDAWDFGGTRYLDLQGNDLGFEDRSFMAKFGQQGTWGVTLSYDGIPYEGSTEFPSVWQRNGATVPGVPPGSIPLVYPSTPFVPGHGSVNSLWLPVPSSTLGRPTLQLQPWDSARHIRRFGHLYLERLDHHRCVPPRAQDRLQSPTPWKSAARSG